MKSKIQFYLRKIEIPVEGGEVARYYFDLMYVKYKKPYCWLYFSDGAKYIAEISVRDLMKNLPEKPFLQCNRTDIVNLRYYRGYDDDSMTVILEGGKKFGLSFCNLEAFKTKKANLKYLSPPCLRCLDCNKAKCKHFWLFCKASTLSDCEKK